MSHMHWVARQKLVEIPNDEAEVNTRDIHKCDGQAHDPDTMVAPLTPKPTRKAETLARAPPTIASRREEDAALKEVAMPRYRCASCIPETKTNKRRKQFFLVAVINPPLFFSSLTFRGGNGEETNARTPPGHRPLSSLTLS